MRSRKSTPTPAIEAPAAAPNHAKPQRKPRYGKFLIDPTATDYENVVGTCQECNHELIVNRATDLRYTYPSSGEKFRCSNCRRLLRISGDIANHPIDQIVFDAYEPLLRRRYMQCVIMLSQSLEFALVMCIAAHVMKAARSMRGAASSEQHLKLEEAFRIAIDRLTLEALRRVAAHLAIQGSPPRSRDQAFEVIRAIPKMTKRLPSADEIASITDAELREAIEILCKMWFVKYRNAVIHMAFRPTQSDAEFLYKHVPRLSRNLTRTFGVMRGQLVMPPRAGGPGTRI